MNNINSSKKKLSSEQREELFRTLKVRFEKTGVANEGLEWAKVHARLETCLSGRQANAEKLWSLNEMERTDSKSDVVGYNKKTGEYIFYDCSEKTPCGRRSVCYDREGLKSREEHKPKKKRY